MKYKIIAMNTKDDAVSIEVSDLAEAKRKADEMYALGGPVSVADDNAVYATRDAQGIWTEVE